MNWLVAYAGFAVGFFVGALWVTCLFVSSLPTWWGEQ